MSCILTCITYITCHITHITYDTLHTLHIISDNIIHTHKDFYEIRSAIKATFILRVAFKLLIRTLKQNVVCYLTLLDFLSHT